MELGSTSADGGVISARMLPRGVATSCGEPVVAEVCCLPRFFGRARTPLQVGPGSSCWVEGETVSHCPLCEVEFGVQHKHVTRRHCRQCGGIFCYMCTYDKAALRTGAGLGFGLTSGKTSNVHVCTRCYDTCPPPVDGFRRCRFCHQRVRLAYFDAHHSVCLEEQYGRAQVMCHLLDPSLGSIMRCVASFSP